MRPSPTLTLLALGLLATLLAAPFMLESFIRSATYPAPPVRVPAAPPPPLEAVELAPDTGERVTAWLGPAEGARSGRPAGIFLHGNGDNLETLRRAGLYRRLDRLGLPWLALDYPGYGRSTGTPEETNLVASAVAALELVEGRWPERPVVLVGWSLGAAVAVQVARRHPGRVEGLVLLSPFTSLLDAAAVHFPTLLVKPLLAGRYDSLAAAPELPHPALVIHGARDRVIPARQGERLAAAWGGPVHRVTVQGVGHNGLLGRDEVWDEMERFLDRVSMPRE